MSECATAVRARYELQVLHCRQQAERQARLIGFRPAVPAPAQVAAAPMPVDLICGYLAIGAAVGMSTATLVRRLRRGDVPVFRVSGGKGRPTFGVRLADLPRLRRNRATGEVLQ